MMPQPGRSRDELGSESDNDDKEMSLTEYDKTRKVVPLVRGRSIVMNTKSLTTELTCPICLDLLTTTMTTKECLHRFCSECISMALLRGNKECPTCRTKLVSKRSLRHDTNFDELIKRIWPDRHKYEEMLIVANQDGDDALSSMVAFTDDYEDEKKNEPLEYDPYDIDAPTPPALLDSRRTTSPMMQIVEECSSGRRTPPWFTMGNIRKEELGLHEKKLFMEAQAAYLKLKSRRLGSKLAGLSRVFDCVSTETHSKASRDSSPPREPHAKVRKMNNGGARRVTGDMREDGKSIASSAGSMHESDSDRDDGARFEVELDKDDMEEIEMMDHRMFLIETSKETKKAKKKKVRKAPIQVEFTNQPSTSTAIVTTPVIPYERPDPTPFDPRLNSNAPYPDVVEHFAELMPNGKGATWQAPIDPAADQPPGPEEDIDEELVFDEDDVISAISIDDMLNEMDTVPHENEVESLYKERNGSLFADLNKETPEDKEVAKYLCEETKLHLRELNELRAGSFADIKGSLEDTEQFELGEAITWYSQMKDGEEIVYYEKSKQPLTRGRRRTTTVYNMEEEVERLGRRVLLKDVIDEMSNTESDQRTPVTLSFVSTDLSSLLSVSDIHDEEDEPVTAPLPPLNPNINKERLHAWLGEIGNHPNTPESIDPLDRRATEEEDHDDCESLPENYEIEAELRPSAALLAREVPREVTQTRFIRTQHTTTMEHLGEFLYLRWLEEVQGRTRENEVAPDVPRPEHFYVFNRADRHCKCVLHHEPLVTAQSLTAREDHVVIYFDTQRALLSSQEMSLLEKIVPQKDRADNAPTSPRESTGSSSSR